ncbi:MAG: SMP-30/gluconolactonase/LRE family protein [Planctomycetales bacterium]|nr:SMP-30/gluconolactonase/LRE family protein [Planctomycetales bacterium]
MTREENPMRQHATRLLHEPATPELRFLPEGPMPVRDDCVSWVAIQHGADSTRGSVHTLSASGEQRQYDLPERPGFAFPERDGQSFLVGVQGRVQRLHVVSGELEPLSDEVEADNSETIVNDGLAVPGGVIFGTKHLKFERPVGGLYLWREGSPEVRLLQPGQICSNGKDVRQVDGQWRLIDIDSPSFKIVEYPLDIASASLGEGRVIVDLEQERLFPDGMALTPDERSLVVALYNPQPGSSTPGEVRQYSLSGFNQQEAVWQLPGAPQVTCPQWVRWEGRVQLLITTAVEHMPDDVLRRHPQSGCLFLGDCDFESLREPLSGWVW